MKDFQIINSTSRAYQFVWNNRVICARYGVFPFVAQLLCYAALVMMGMEDNILRQGLFMLPAYFAEGAVICLLVKFALDSLPNQGALFTTEHPLKDTQSEDHKTRLTAGTIMFVLVQIAFVVGISLWLRFMIANGMFSEQPAEPNASTAFISMAIFMIALWSIRLAWLYVPIIMGFGMKRYLRVVSKFTSSFYMIGIALLCSIPVMFGTWIVMQFVIAAMGVTPDNLTMTANLTLSVFQIFAGLLTTLLTSIAMAYALYPLMSGHYIDEEI